MRVVAEVLFARIAGRALRFQVARLDLARSRGDPDESAREFADMRRREPDAVRVVHSTSWRYERGGIVLSYLVYSTGSPSGAAHALRVSTRCLRRRSRLGMRATAIVRALRRLRPAAAGRVRHARLALLE